MNDASPVNATEQFMRLQKLADDPKLVFSVYGLVLTPLALYVYHDILDTRWRPVWRLSRYLVAYVLLYISAGTMLIGYIVLQAVFGNDYKEVGASALAFILGTYGAWKLVRLARIIVAHRSLVCILQRIDRSLAKTTGLDVVGMEYHLFRKPNTAHVHSQAPHNDWDYKTRHDFISSYLFDDDYPGESAARIRWLAFPFGSRVIVLQDDADECASRLALWMRLVLRRPRSEPWKLLTCTSPFVQGQLYRPGIGEALRSLILHGSGKMIPRHANRNPAEVMINKLEKGSLTEAGIGFFWIASEMGFDEISQVLAEMPPRWMRGVSQNGKQLMFELVMSLLLCDMPDPVDSGVHWILSLPVLDWRRDVSNVNLWSKMSEICADAVCSVLPRYSLQGDQPALEEVYGVVQRGVFALQEATSEQHGFQGDIVGLSLIELIRASYRSSYLAEKILGKQLNSELKRYDFENVDLQIYKAEIVTGLFSILEQIGQDENKEYLAHFQQMKTNWDVDADITNVFLAMRMRAANAKHASFNFDIAAQSKCWYLGDREGRCEDPATAFGTAFQAATDVAPLVMLMMQNYMKEKPVIRLFKGCRNPGQFKEQWVEWKKNQAYDIGGSTEGIAEVLDSQTQNELHSVIRVRVP